MGELVEIVMSFLTLIAIQIILVLSILGQIAQDLISLIFTLRYAVAIALVIGAFGYAAYRYIKKNRKNK